LWQVRATSGWAAGSVEEVGPAERDAKAASPSFVSAAARVRQRTFAAPFAQRH